MISDKDKEYLRRCVDLAKEAVNKGDEPFGSVLVLDEKILFEDHNHVAGGDHTQHPEFNIARWSASNLTEEERQRAVVYTSGEHCPMCSAAHGWVGLGRIVYASSSDQLTDWLKEIGVKASRVKTLAIEDVITDTIVDGPVLEFSDEIRALHIQSAKNKLK